MTAKCITCYLPQTSNCQCHAEFRPAGPRVAPAKAAPAKKSTTLSGKAIGRFMREVRYEDRTADIYTSGRYDAES